MKKIMVYDNETTGIPLWQEPSGSKRQPHIVQLGAKIFDAETWRVIHQIEFIIKPEGWTIPQEVVDIHGIDDAYAAEVGIPEDIAVGCLIALASTCDLRVAHGESFDARIIRIGLKRFGWADETLEFWKSMPKICTRAMGNVWGTKHGIEEMKFRSKPHLAGMYKHFTGQDMANAHSVTADINACATIYRAMTDEA